MTMIVKRGINGQLDTMGFTTALAHSFDLHELAHGMQASARAAAGITESGNVLEQMRATNRAIAEKQAATA
jgi:hypothetical protein